MFCYRRSGHNEADEPMFTQPLMYKMIKKHQTTLNLYKDQLVKEEILTEDEAKNKISDFKEFLDNELRKAVNQAIEQLPPRCQAIYKLSRFEELSYKEISNRLELPLNTVKVTLLRAKKVLAQKITNHEE